MKGKNKDNRSRRGAFFWKIPGDVPGYRSEPDPYQSARAARNAEYQLTPGSSVNPHGNARLNPGRASVGNPVKWLSLLLLLLFLSGMVFVGYDHYVNDVGTTPTAEPKVYELTLGEQTRTPQSKVRIITHVVVKGDTLWDIAETYVKDPFRYPELAELSKIKNPDLIYPYDLVRIRIYE
jgi:nucleoid-associated protein YgaU